MRTGALLAWLASALVAPEQAPIAEQDEAVTRMDQEQLGRPRTQASAAGQAKAPAAQDAAVLAQVSATGELKMNLGASFAEVPKVVEGAPGAQQAQQTAETSEGGDIALKDAAKNTEPTPTASDASRAPDASWRTSPIQAPHTEPSKDLEGAGGRQSTSAADGGTHGGTDGGTEGGTQAHESGSSPPRDGREAADAARGSEESGHPAAGDTQSKDAEATGAGAAHSDPKGDAEPQHVPMEAALEAIRPVSQPDLADHEETPKVPMEADLSEGEHRALSSSEPGPLKPEPGVGAVGGLLELSTGIGYGAGSDVTDEGPPNMDAALTLNANLAPVKAEVKHVKDGQAALTSLQADDKRLTARVKSEDVRVHEEQELEEDNKKKMEKINADAKAKLGIEDDKKAKTGLAATAALLLAFW